MNCMICKAELEKEEKWDGSIIFSCPLCNREKSKSTKAPREESIPNCGGRHFALGTGYSNMDWNKAGEEDD